MYTGEKPYKCDVCGKGYSAAQILQIHKMAHHREQQYKCDVCGKWFGTAHIMQIHKLTHTKKQQYKCYVCAKVFNESGNLQKHTKNHTDMRLSHTGNRTKLDRTRTVLRPPLRNQATHLQRHTEICTGQNILPHVGKKPPIVDINSFTKARHLQTPADKTCYLFEYCGRGFSDANDSQQHIKTHTRETTGGYADAVYTAGNVSPSTTLPSTAGNISPSTTLPSPGPSTLQYTAGNVSPSITLPSTGPSTLQALTHTTDVKMEAAPEWTQTSPAQALTHKMEAVPGRTHTSSGTGTDMIDISTECETKSVAECVTDSASYFIPTVVTDSVAKCGPKSILDGVTEYIPNCDTNVKMASCVDECSSIKTEYVPVCVTGSVPECVADYVPMGVSASDPTCATEAVQECATFDTDVKMESGIAVFNPMHIESAPVCVTDTVPECSSETVPEYVSVSAPECVTDFERELYTYSGNGVYYIVPEHVNTNITTSFSLQGLVTRKFSQNELNDSKQTSTQPSRDPVKQLIDSPTGQQTGLLRTHSRDKDNSHASAPCSKEGTRETCDCGTGGQESSRTHLLMKQINTHTEAEQYTCEFCDRTYSFNKSQLQSHVRRHTGDKPYTCVVCGKGFGQAAGLRKHNVVHTGEKPYKCDVCYIEFSSVGSLNRHIKTITCEKPYTCGVCGKGFSQAAGLRKHNVVHTGEKPYKCDVCSRGLSSAENLNRHSKTHTGDSDVRVLPWPFLRDGTLTYE